MNIVDFFIGLTLMNAMPHFVLGVWKGRMLSGFGVGDTKNILYGLLNFAISITLYLSKYGVGQILENGIFTGALFVLLMYFVLGKSLKNRFEQE